MLPSQSMYIQMFKRHVGVTKSSIKIWIILSSNKCCYEENHIPLNDVFVFQGHS